MVNIKNPQGFRRCYLCNQMLPATIDYFPKDKNRALGIGYQCRPCAKIETKKRTKPRPDRWKNSTIEQKERKKEWQRKYAPKNRVIYLISAYRNIDKNKGRICDLTKEWFDQNIKDKTCIYCGDIKSPIGCDRINNFIGHVKTNIVPCCELCNTTRMNNFTHLEMLELGKAIAYIKSKRG